jgi:hypothetical protein
MNERRPNSDLMTMVGALAVTALPLATQRLFAHIVSSPRRSFASRAAMILGRAELPGRGELAALRPATRFLMVGLTVWIGLVGLATVLAVASVEMSTMSLPAWFGAPASASPSIEIRSAAGFENILQRPLFSRSRQAAAPAVATLPSLPVPVTLDQNITLRGVFMNGALAKAFLTSAQNPLGVWVQANEEIAGWRVVAVQHDQVLLDAQNEKLVIPLAVNGRAK